jgi:hypothetical protein
MAQLVFSALKMDAICSSERSVDTQRTTQRYIPEDGTLLILLLLNILEIAVSILGVKDHEN